MNKTAGKDQQVFNEADYILGNKLHVLQLMIVYTIYNIFWWGFFANLSPSLSFESFKDLDNDPFGMPISSHDWSLIYDALL